MLLSLLLFFSKINVRHCFEVGTQGILDESSHGVQVALLENSPTWLKTCWRRRQASTRTKNMVDLVVRLLIVLFVR